MKSNIPEHFTALIKQYANLTNNDQAVRLVIEISEGLEVTLSEDSRKLFFAYSPKYLQPRQSKFYDRMFLWNKHYKHKILLQRLQLLQNLTDAAEAESRIKAYFKAIKIVSSKKTYANIVHILPPELQHLV